MPEGLVHELASLSVEHLVLVGISMLLAALIAIPSGIMLSHRSHSRDWALGLTNVIQTIPSLALFGFLIPFTGLGLLTAEIALVSYTILILVRNIVAGIDGVPRAVREAADGMGYTRRRRLWTVELPLALPTIIAGLRIASVTIIGLVTIAALVGIGGYGTFIDDGLSRNFSTPIVLGAVLSVALALLVDVAFAALLWVLTPWRRRAAVRTT
jgi:osmoprotectant transport system permease protein